MTFKQFNEKYPIIGKLAIRYYNKTLFPLPGNIFDIDASTVINNFVWDKTSEGVFWSDIYNYCVNNKGRDIERARNEYPHLFEEENILIIQNGLML